MDHVLKHLDRLVLVMLSFSIWTGTRRLRPEDIQLGQGGNLPPEDVASLGSKKIVDPAILRPMHNAKRQAERACLELGVRFLGGYAIPRTRQDELRAALEEAQRSFEAGRQQLAQDYLAALHAWQDRHPSFARALAAAAEPLERILPRCSSGHVVVTVTPDAADAGQLAREVAALGGTALDEVAVEAGTLVEDLLQRQPPYNRRLLKPLARLRAKLAGLAFLDPALLVLVERLGGLLTLAGQAGRLDGPIAGELLGTLIILGDADKARRFADGLYTPKDGLDELGLSLPTMPSLPKPAPAAAALPVMPQRTDPDLFADLAHLLAEDDDPAPDPALPALPEHDLAAVPCLAAPAATPAINLAAAPPPARPAQEGFYF